MARRWAAGQIGEEMFILLIYIYAGALASGDSVALVSVPGFTSEAACNEAGKKTAKFVAASTKEHRFVCVKQ